MKNSSIFFILTLCFAIDCQAQEWAFGNPITISDSADKTFHHLESSGRRNIAVASQIVAVVWEDNRDEKASIYLALKDKKHLDFSTELKISGSEDAFEPSIIALPGSRFAISWEEDNQVFIRVVNAAEITSPKLGNSLKLPIKNTMQSSLAANQEQIFVALAERNGRNSRIRLVQLQLEQKLNLNLLKHCQVDLKVVKDEQLYPSVILQNKNGEKTIVLAWEDRRMGHTIIMGSESKVEQFCQFSPVQRISKREGKSNLPYGKGHGVSRVALDTYGDSGIFAAWADKRDFREGYDIYAAEYGASAQWSDNQKVQDDFGGVARQWHATVAGHPKGLRVVAWSDERENNSDVFYSLYENGEWSEDFPVPGASDEGEQSHPSITLDKDANIHLAWVHRSQVGGITTLKYIMGRLTK